MWIVVIIAVLVNLLSLSQGMLKDISFELLENCSIGTVVGNIKLSAELYVFKNLELHLENTDYYEDAQSMSNNRFSKSPRNLFKINNITGDLMTVAEIDRETLCQSIILKRNENCTVLQIISVNKLMWINININIIDVNDNAPVFRLNTLPITISEISKVNIAIILEEPIDLDSERFQPIHYSIFPKSMTSIPFDLIQNPLKLLLIGPLDYETTRKYEAVIVACDKGTPPLCGNQTLNIDITNENDESPQFLRSNYTAIINEDAPVGQLVVSPVAFDKDEGDYGRLEYSFSSGFEEVKKYFTIDKDSGEITVMKTVNHPTKFKFSIKAIDKAPNPLIGRTWIILHVVDVNNNSPVILINPKDSILISKFQNQTVIEITENNKVPCQMAYITVSDQDQGENARCSCQIQSETEKEILKYFRIVNVNEMSERSIFKLVAEKSFDAEENRQFSIVIICFDHGEPPNYAKTGIEILIKDENEYPPVFDQKVYEVYIDENSAPGTVVKTIKVFDKDVIHSNIFDITSPGSTFFNINSSGTLYTKALFDYEKQQKLSFHILAINRGIKSFTSSVLVIVSIMDVNDNPPEFSMVLNKFDIFENIKGHYEIGKIEAFDKDSGINSKLNYYLLNSTVENNSKLNHLKTFILNEETGVISSNVSLDYEECDLYVITVKIVDNGHPPLSSVQAFYIHVIDVNDNGPVWQYPNIRDNIMNISVQNVRDSVLTRVRAVDNDGDRYNVINYYLLSHNDIFNINQLTGVITFKSLHVKSGQMTLHLQAVDANSRTLHSSQILIVYIMDDDRYYLQISISSSLTFPVMICIIGISSLISIVLIIFVFYFCYRKRCMHRNFTHSSVANNSRQEEKISDIKSIKDNKKKNDIPLDLVTDNDAFNQNTVEDSMKLILDPLYTSISSSSNVFQKDDKDPKIQSLLCKRQADNIYQNLILQGYAEEYQEQKRNPFRLQTHLSGVQSPSNPHHESCDRFSMYDSDLHSHFEISKGKPFSKTTGLDSRDSMTDSYATFLNCSCTNAATTDLENSSPLNKIVAAPFVFNGSAWIPNTLNNEKIVIQTKKDMTKQQPLKSIMKKTPASASFINVDSSSSSGHCNDTDQASSTHDSGCIVGYSESRCLPVKPISLLDNTYHCKTSQV